MPCLAATVGAEREMADGRTGRGARDCPRGRWARAWSRPGATQRHHGTGSRREAQRTAPSHTDHRGAVADAEAPGPAANEVLYGGECGRAEAAHHGEHRPAAFDTRHDQDRDVWKWSDSTALEERAVVVAQRSTRL
jgi:hypothetical protein